MSKYYEPQYEILDESIDRNGGVSKLGIMSSFTWNDDPKRLLFVLSRYKTVAKMLQGQKSVLEIGCGDAFASRIVKQHVTELTVVDIDPLMVENARTLQSSAFPLKTACHNFLEGPTEKNYSAAYMLDVLEHINDIDEKTFLINIVRSLDRHGILIVGIPSIESQEYASPGSKLGHVNCKSLEQLKELMENYFYNVFMFSMNDEVLHTGFSRMSNYLFALCASPIYVGD